jgi:hypothetical protein
MGTRVESVGVSDRVHLRVPVFMLTMRRADTDDTNQALEVRTHAALPAHPAFPGEPSA